MYDYHYYYYFNYVINHSFFIHYYYCRFYQLVNIGVRNEDSVSVLAITFLQRNKRDKTTVYTEYNRELMDEILNSHQVDKRIIDLSSPCLTQTLYVLLLFLLNILLFFFLLLCLL